MTLQELGPQFAGEALLRCSGLQERGHAPACRARQLPQTHHAPRAPPSPVWVPALKPARGVGTALPVSQLGCFLRLLWNSLSLTPHPAPGLHPLGKYSAHVSSSLGPTSSRHPGPRPPPPPSSSSSSIPPPPPPPLCLLLLLPRLAVTSHNPAGAASPAPRDPAAVHAPLC